MINLNEVANVLVKEYHWNFYSGKPYNGVNNVLLEKAMKSNNWTKKEWASFLQWRQLGYKVKKGEKATTIIYFNNEIKEVVDKNGKVKKERYLVRRIYKVFNIEQVEKIKK